MGIKRFLKKGKWLFTGLALGGALLTKAGIQEDNIGDDKTSPKIEKRIKRISKIPSNQHNLKQKIRKDKKEESFGIHSLIIKEKDLDFPQSKVFHCSPKEIDVFDPSKSKSFKKLVFATPYKTLSYMYGADEHGDYLFRPVCYQGKMLLVEMQPNVLEKHYRGKSAFLYTFNANDFPERTQWSGEVGTSKIVKPESKLLVSDLEQSLLEAVQKDGLELLRFSDRNKYFNADELVAAVYMKKLLSPSPTSIEKLGLLGWLAGLNNKEIYHQLKKNVNILTKKLQLKKHPPQKKTSLTPVGQLAAIMDVAHTDGFEKAFCLLDKTSSQDAEVMKNYLMPLQGLIQKREKSPHSFGHFDMEKQ